MSEWLVRHKKRIGIALAGHTGKQVEEVVLDWLLYGYVSYTFTAMWGMVWGTLLTFAVMAPFSAFMCLMYLKLYDWARLDIFGFEAIKGLRDLESKADGLYSQLLRRMLRWGDVPAFVALSIYGDPFMVTVYLRKEEHQYQGLTKRDWRIFWSAAVFSNVYWTLRWTVIFEAIRYFWSLNWAGIFTQVLNWMG